MDILMTLGMSAIALVGWWTGALKPHAQHWIRWGVVPASVWLGFYFFLQLSLTEPALVTGEAEVGWPTLFCMIGGVCALLTSPREDDGNKHQDNGAAAT